MLQFLFGSAEQSVSSVPAELSSALGTVNQSISAQVNGTFFGPEAAYMLAGQNYFLEEKCQDDEAYNYHLSQQNFQNRINAIVAQNESRMNLGFVAGRALRAGYDAISVQVPPNEVDLNERLHARYELNPYSIVSWAHAGMRFLNGRNALADAVFAKDYQAVEALSQRYDVNQPDSYGKKPVDFAIAGDDARMVQLLMDLGADVSSQELTAAIRNHRNNVVALLADADISVDECGPNADKNCAFFAMSNDNTQAATVFINRGVDPFYVENVKNFEIDGRQVTLFSNLLYGAMISRDASILVPLLLEKGLSGLSTSTIHCGDYTSSILNLELSILYADKKRDLFTYDLLAENFRAQGLTKESLPENGARTLLTAIRFKNEDAVKLLLSLDVDVHQHLSINQYDALNLINGDQVLEASPYQAAMISNSQIKKLVREHHLNKLPAPVQGPKPKNSWTAHFERVIKELINLDNEVAYRAVSNDYGNTFFNPIINGVEQPMDQIIHKMDWEQVTLSEPQVETMTVGEMCLGASKILNPAYMDIEFYSHISKLEAIAGCGYRDAYSWSLNAFLKGEAHLLVGDNWFYNLEGQKLTNELITRYWLDSALIANTYGKIVMSDPNKIIFRSQRTEDRLVRANHLSFVSTTENEKFSEYFDHDRNKQAEKIIFEVNTGKDVSYFCSREQSNEYVQLPINLPFYEKFTINGIYYTLAKNGREHQKLRDEVEVSGAETTPEEYTSKFTSLIDAVVRDDEGITVAPQMNRYGQTYYDIIINGTRHDMYELSSNMDWSYLRLNEKSLAAIKTSKYKLWDEQSYITGNTAKSSVDQVFEPVKLYDIDNQLDLTSRPALKFKAPICADLDVDSCSYDNIYKDLTATDKGLIFQYTSASSKATNAFLKGSVKEFEQNIKAHTNRWSSTCDISNKQFDISDPLQWWVYSARLIDALNRIRPSAPHMHCRGQSHMDRYIRYNHAAPISTSTDSTVCQNYAPTRDKGHTIKVSNTFGKDITGLSFHPDQQEYLSPPALLRSYSREDDSMDATMKARVVPSRLNS